MTSDVYRKLGLGLWRAIPVSLKPELDPHYDIRLYGISFWGIPATLGVLWWYRRRSSSAPAEPAAEGSGK